MSARSINKRLTQLHAIFRERAQRVHGLGNPVEAESGDEERSGDIRVLAPDEVELIAAELDGQDAALTALPCLSWAPPRGASGASVE